MADVVLDGRDAILPGTHEVIMNVHLEGDCLGDFCPIHRPSDHIMRDFDMHWRDDRYLMERICPHGIGHPDPDDPKIQFHMPGEGIHSCDGCCG